MFLLASIPRVSCRVSVKNIARASKVASNSQSLFVTTGSCSSAQNKTAQFVSSSSSAAFTCERRNMSTKIVTYPTEALTEHVRDTILRAKAVCFDVDSTVITVEGIDELAAHAGKKEAVAALTRQAMGGSVPFHEALEARLKIINPTSKMLQDFLQVHPFSLTPGVEQVISMLQARGTSVYLVSGGFTQMIYPVATKLNIPLANVYANTILFDAQTGNYAGFDRTAFTSRDGGKAEAVKHLKATQIYAPLIMVGDGATDMQARPPADIMIGYGGIVVRDVVAKGADWFIRDFAHVVEILQGSSSNSSGSAGSGSASKRGVVEGGRGMMNAIGAGGAGRRGSSGSAGSASGSSNSSSSEGKTKKKAPSPSSSKLKDVE